jgi:hypothetical protein
MEFGNDVYYVLGSGGHLGYRCRLVLVIRDMT